MHQVQDRFTVAIVKGWKTSWPCVSEHSTIWRLVCKSRSERCLLYNPNRLQPPAVPEVEKGRAISSHAFLLASPVAPVHSPRY